jgi:8-oxo-dGTP pyrophosphatase MutT (NUDIX family)
VTAPSTGVPTEYLALRDDARALLSGWAAPDAQQDALRVELLEHLDGHADAMWKQGPPAHLTASALVLSPSLDKVLLTLHAKAGLWLQFGGHFEPEDTSVLAAATREVREESGIVGLELAPELVHIDRHRLVASGFGRCREHLDLRYAGVATDESGFAVSAESLDVRWWPVDDLPTESGDEILPLAVAARRLLG